MPDHQRARQPQRAYQLGDRGRLRGRACVGSSRTRRIAGARAVDKDEPELAGKLARQRVAEINKLLASPWIMTTGEPPPPVST